MADAVDFGPQDVNRRDGRMPKWVFVLFILLIVSIFTYGYWWLFVRGKVSTDNAYVTADSATIGSRVAGTISRIMVENDDQINSGAVLIELDPRDYQAEVDRKRAALTRIGAEIEVAEVNIRLTDSQTGAQLEAAEALVQAAQDRERELRHKTVETEQNRVAAQAEFGHAKKDFERYTNLLKEGAGSEQQRDRTSTAFKKAQAQYEASNAQISASKATLAAAVQEVDRARAQRDAAKADRLRVEIAKNNLVALKAKRSETLAELQTAELNLSYCTIKAPISGYIARKKIQVGDRVQPGQALLAVVPLKEVYVEANFKETQLRNVRLGQPVEMEADIYPGRVYHGKVAGIRAGTGAAFSLLPPENATGNWIKIVQRIPVKILLDAPPPAESPLRVGSSLEVTIFTGDRSGPMLRPVGSTQAKQ